ncbi:MAG: hypothetical protein Terrestrivirus4_187 [Terrestrivirus sp.]|jgi:hypothetical protein|uniref:Uncharacterized protein n=1 Tax=Terrestrivirus sp. TaxID=2487775 RepID=A0A3G4ZRU8_9VIRU|nr:MAG: hypothetical protein Terrestrivirus4_187 [Terrestrivirus sp.]
MSTIEELTKENRIIKEEFKQLRILVEKMERYVREEFNDMNESVQNIEDKIDSEYVKR